MLEAIKMEPNFDEDIYLTEQVETLFDRIRDRNREGEDYITIKFL